MASPAENKAKTGEDEIYSHAKQLASGVALPMVLHSVCRLGLFEIIAKAGPGAQVSPSEIVANLSTKNPEQAVLMVDRMLRLLASHSVVTCSNVAAAVGGGGGVTRVYGLTPVAKYFVRNPDLEGASMASVMALHQNKVFIESWYALDDAVLEGGVPFNMVHGVHAFEYPGKDPKFNEVFNEAMVSNAAYFIKGLLDTYKGFEDLKRLVDVGGGLGFTISRIANKYPTIKGINFDLPHVVQHAPAYSGVQNIGGDMFLSVPEGDAIFMKSILHDWDDDRCVKLLKNCYKSLPDNGKVIVADMLLPVNIEASSLVQEICQVDMVMLTQNPGGKERTEQEFRALATSSGFRGFKKQCCVCDFWVMEFYK